MRVLWIGGVAWPDSFKKMVSKGNKQAAANITQFNLIQGLEHHLKEPVDILNGHLMASYPHYKDILIPHRKWSHCKEAYDVDVAFINLPLIKHLTKGFGLRKHAIRWAKSVRKNDGLLFVYSLHSPYLWAAVAAKRFNPSLRLCCIVPDLPQYMDLGLSKKPFKRFFKKIDRWIIDHFLKSFDYFVLFTKHMAEALNIKGRSWIVMEGIIDPKEFQSDKCQEEKETGKVIMYSGGMDIQYGIPELLEAFKLIPESNYQLWLTGDGSARGLIIEAMKQDPRIKWFGFLPSRKEVLEKQQQATMLINMRLPTKASAYCFPSKIFEYMASGRPVLSFRINGIPDEYYDYLVEIKELSNEEIVKAIKSVANMSSEEREEFGDKARKFVFNNKNALKQAQKILNFIN